MRSISVRKCRIGPRFAIRIGRPGIEAVRQSLQDFPGYVALGGLAKGCGLQLFPKIDGNPDIDSCVMCHVHDKHITRAPRQDHPNERFWGLRGRFAGIRGLGSRWIVTPSTALAAFRPIPAGDIGGRLPAVSGALCVQFWDRCVGFGRRSFSAFIPNPLNILRLQ